MIIYKITNLINGKLYIGQTRSTIHKRFAQRCKFRKNKSNTYISKAINKYGRNNFKIEVLEICNCPVKLDALEKHYILLLNTIAPNGYNLSYGGTVNRNHSILSKNKISNSLKEYYSRGGINPMKGMAGVKSPVSLPVKCLQTGEIFQSSSEACKKYNISCGSISEVLNGLKKHCKGLEFVFLDGIKNKKRRCSTKPVLCITNDTVYSSVAVAAKSLGCIPSHISAIARGGGKEHRKSTKGYKFIYLDRIQELKSE